MIRAWESHDHAVHVGAWEPANPTAPYPRHSMIYPESFVQLSAIVTSLFAVTHAGLLAADARLLEGPPTLNHVLPHRT